MRNTVLLGQSGQITEIPQLQWEAHFANAAEHGEARRSFMSNAHREVRYFVVREMPRIGEPITPEVIGEAMNLSKEQVNTILDDLERKLFFLVRNEQGAVTWAYPVTVEPTPHRITFKSGERLYAAWGEDSFAVPFVQGHLLGENVSVEIETECTHCGRSLHITLDTEMNFQVHNKGAAPLIFEPHVDWQTFTDPNIIDAY